MRGLRNAFAIKRLISEIILMNEGRRHKMVEFITAYYNLAQGHYNPVSISLISAIKLVKLSGAHLLSNLRRNILIYFDAPVLINFLNTTRLNHFALLSIVTDMMRH